MDVTNKPFARYISDKQMELLKTTAARPEGAWLREALADPDLLFTLRDKRVDVYFRGQVIYSIEIGTEKIATYTHVKYLVLDGPAPYIKMQDGTFAYRHTHLHDVYRDGVSLGQIKSAANTYAGAESKGIYKVIKRDRPSSTSRSLSLVATISRSIVPRRSSAPKIGSTWFDLHRPATVTISSSGRLRTTATRTYSTKASSTSWTLTPGSWK